jgi:hypothetical protein
VSVHSRQSSASRRKGILGSRLRATVIQVTCPVGTAAVPPKPDRGAVHPLSRGSRDGDGDHRNHVFTIREGEARGGEVQGVGAQGMGGYPTPQDSDRLKDLKCFCDVVAGGRFIDPLTAGPGVGPAMLPGRVAGLRDFGHVPRAHHEWLG